MPSIRLPGTAAKAKEIRAIDIRRTSKAQEPKAGHCRVDCTPRRGAEESLGGTMQGYCGATEISPWVSPAASYARAHQAMGPKTEDYPLGGT